MENNTLKNQAYYEIKTRILNCDFPPGILLNESMLCDLLSISRTPIRDALSRLENENLVRITPPKGVMVTDITITDVNSFFETLLQFDPYIIRTYGQFFSKERIAELIARIQNRTQIQTGDILDIFMYDFREILVTAAGNPYISELYEYLTNLEQRIFHLIAIHHENFSSLLQHMDVLLQELSDENWEKAAAAVKTMTLFYQDTIIATFLEHARSCLPPKKTAADL